jgi:hypothetical protein
VPYSPPPWYAPPAPYTSPPPTQYARPEPERRHTAPGNWYGWQTLIAVAPFDIAMFASLSRFSTPAGTDTFAVAFTARNLVPAVVHLAHGRAGRAFGSVGLQAATTATGLVIGYAFGIALEAPCLAPDPCRNNFRGFPPGPDVGAIVGSMAGTVLDVVFFAHRTRLTWTVARNEPSWTVAPFATQRSVGLAAGWSL